MSGVVGKAMPHASSSRRPPKPGGVIASKALGLGVRRHPRQTPRPRWLAALLLACLALVLSLPAFAAVDPLPFKDHAEEVRFQNLTKQLRCVVCQNESLNDSSAPLAADLRRDVFEQMRGGKSDAQIKDWLTARYSDFVLYDPPLRRRHLAALVRTPAGAPDRRLRGSRHRAPASARGDKRDPGRAPAERHRGRLVMPIFMLLAALMVAAALAFVVVPLLRNARRGSAESPAQRLLILDRAHQAGLVDAAEYAAKRAALGDPEATHPGSSDAARATLVALLMALLLPAAALFLYRVVGTPQALDPAGLAAGQAAAHGDRGPQMEQAIGLLVARLKEHPEDVEGWALLGRAYQSTNRIDDSLAAFKRAHQAAPDNTSVSVEYAQALALAAPDHRIEGESRALLEGVLKAEPQSQRALWLLGIGDYQAQRYDAAIARWNTLLPLLEPDSEVATSVQRQIAEAQALRDGQPPAEALANAAPAQDVAVPGTVAAAAPPAAADGPAPKLTVQVSLDPRLKDRLDPDATLFVFARAASGPPMPLAIQRLKASQLPLTVTLDDSMGMLPNMKLGMFPQVVIGARVSKSGNALAQSGDLQALSAPLDVRSTQPIALSIDQTVP